MLSHSHFPRLASAQFRSETKPVVSQAASSPPHRVSFVQLASLSGVLFRHAVSSAQLDFVFCEEDWKTPGSTESTAACRNPPETSGPALSKFLSLESRHGWGRRRSPPRPAAHTSWQEDSTGSGTTCGDNVVTGGSNNGHVKLTGDYWRKSRTHTRIVNIVFSGTHLLPPEKR